MPLWPTMYSDEHDANITSMIRDPPAGVYAGNTMAITPVNHVGGVSLCCPLPQESILRSIPGLAPQQFTAVSVRISQPEVTFLLFSGGNVRVTGAKSKSAFFLGIHQLRTFLASKGYAARIANVSLDNIVGRCTIGHTLKVEAIETAILQNMSPLQGTAIYEPELFSALIYRIRISNCKITITVFESGRIMVLGITDMKKASLAVKRFQEFAIAFKHDKTDTSQQKEKSKKRSHQRAFEKKQREEKDDEDEFLEEMIAETELEDDDDYDDGDEVEQVEEDEDDAMWNNETDTVAFSSEHATQKSINLLLEKKKRKAGRLTMDEVEKIQSKVHEEFSDDLNDEEIVTKIKELARKKSKKKVDAFEKRQEKKNKSIKSGK